MLVDTHVHLHFQDFDGEVNEVMTRARKSSVGYFINVGTDLESSRKSIELAEKYDSVFAAVGIHPHDAEKATRETLHEIELLCQHKKVVAIGEVGLDYFKLLSPREIQEKVIVSFFEMAKRTKLPMIFHIRDAYPEMIKFLKENFQLPIRAVSHCFSGTVSVMEELLELGLFISFAGPVTYKKNDSLKEAAKKCPMDRILVETDAPFLAPQAFRGKRNEPAFMAETAKWIAGLRGISFEEFEAATTRNAETLFGCSFSSID